MSITPPEFLELSNTLNVASLSVIPSSVLSSDLIFSFIHQNSAIIFWVVNAFIFNLAKGGQSYPIGPLALPEGTTEYPSLLNKVYILHLPSIDPPYTIYLIIQSIHPSIYSLPIHLYVVALVFLWTSVCCCYVAGRPHWNHRIPIRWGTGVAELHQLHLLPSRLGHWGRTFFVGMETLQCKMISHSSVFIL